MQVFKFIPTLSIDATCATIKFVPSADGTVKVAGNCDVIATQDGNRIAVTVNRSMSCGSIVDLENIAKMVESMGGLSKVEGTLLVNPMAAGFLGGYMGQMAGRYSGPALIVALPAAKGGIRDLIAAAQIMVGAPERTAVTIHVPEGTVVTGTLKGCQLTSEVKLGNCNLNLDLGSDAKFEVGTNCSVTIAAENASCASVDGHLATVTATAKTFSNIEVCNCCILNEKIEKSCGTVTRTQY